MHTYTAMFNVISVMTSLLFRKNSMLSCYNLLDTNKSLLISFY